MTNRPGEVVSRLLAAIGDPEKCHRGHLFAILRLLAHHKNHGQSLAPICTGYISKKSIVDESSIELLTSSRSEPKVQLNDETERPPKKRRLSKSIPAPVYNTSPSERQLRAFQAALEKESRFPDDYSKPEQWRQLPFLFVHSHLPRRRFNFTSVVDDAGQFLLSTFEWMGRESFTTLVDAVACLGLDGLKPSAAFLLGTIGVGKSHLLAALAVLLRCQGKRVVYVPDCDILVMSPVRYMAAAFLCCFSGQDKESRKKRDEIRSLHDLKAIKAWAEHQYTLGIRFYYIIDQVDALEPSPGSMVTTLQLEEIRSFLLALYCDHIYVRANDERGYGLRGRGQRELVLQTMSDREIRSWTDRFAGRIPTFACNELDRFNDYVGGVFLFYRPLLDYSDMAFGDAWASIRDGPMFRDARESIRLFANKIQTEQSKAAYETYISGAKAFVTGTEVKGICLHLIDHRHCYVRNGRGHVTSGLVRRELVAMLEDYDRNLTTHVVD